MPRNVKLYFSNIVFRASEKKRELIKIGISVFLSILIGALIMGVVIAVTRSALESANSDLSVALVELNFSASTKLEKLNKSLAVTGLHADSLTNIDNEFESFHDEVLELQVQQERIQKVHKRAKVPKGCHGK